MASCDYYEVLGVAGTASQEEIQRAYRTLARRYHPDMSADRRGGERFAEIVEAYRSLSDPGRRARYDRARAGRASATEGRDGRRGREIHVHVGRRSTPFRGGAYGGPDHVLGDFLSRPGRGRQAGPGRGVDREVELEISLEQAYAGVRRTITLETAAGPCGYDVDLPAGTRDGQRIRLPGPGGSDGGLYLVVRIAPHERYRVDGRDLSVEVAVTPWEAALGGPVSVPTPGGAAQVDLPAGSSSGRRLRLRGRGMPDPGGGVPGDLCAVVRIVVPAELTESERVLFERLAVSSRFDPRREEPSGPL